MPDKTDKNKKSFHDHIDSFTLAGLASLAIVCAGLALVLRRRA